MITDSEFILCFTANKNLIMKNIEKIFNVCLNK